MFAGLLAGYGLRNRLRINFSPLVLAAVCLLLFVLGLELGGNGELLARFARIGGTAAVLAVSAVAGSCLAAKVFSRWTPGVTAAQRRDEPKSGCGADKEEEPARDGGMTGSLLILGAFVLGVVLAVCGIAPDGARIRSWSGAVLLLLMVLVGVNLGTDRTLPGMIRSQPVRLLFLPAATVAGTFAGVLLAAALLKCLPAYALDLPLRDALAVGSGFGYYSLSSIFLSEARGAELGTVALTANILRELLTILLAPWMVKYFGRLAPISAGGATTMDTTLPVIQRYAGNGLVPVSVYHGVVMDFSVPFFLTLFLMA